ncbi:MAG: 1-acyl-sn-glycerol-3-phosphate acyltransferase [Oscillospiraceae bacterium]|nr:1-acyl-sn-glycerol-3-phosphate acyltransferase [Oscillospiraceae bacterium]
MIIYRVIKAITCLYANIKFKVEYKGLENIPKEGNYILVSNHRTYSDPPLLGKVIKKQLFFMAKKELFSNPIKSFIFTQLGAFPVNRGKGDTSAIDKSLSILEDKNKILALFPEGTRSKDGKLKKIKSGASYITILAGADILPACLKYHKDAKFGDKLTITFDKLIEFKSLNIESKDKFSPKDIKKINILIEEKIKNMLER